MKVILDTNIVVTMIFPNSKNYWIWKALQYQQLDLYVTTDILDEYEEIIIRRYGEPFLADLFLNALQTLPNLHYVHKFFFWQLIPQDPDDEKFVDGAIAASVDYLVTNDKHFNVLKRIPFPNVHVVNETEFKRIFDASK
jgi:putative PIN family toxin of toxin-antitoxin system